MPRTNKILIRSGTVAPTASDFAVGEPAFDKSAGAFYIKNDAGAMVQIGSGVFTASAGSVSAPSLTFTGDTNTGVYSPGADQWAVATAGTQRISVSAAGDVGIGVAAAANIKLYALQSITNTAGAVANQLVTTCNATVTGSYATFGGYYVVRTETLSGVTNSGAQRALFASCARNNNGANSGDTGTVTYVRGGEIQYGHGTTNVALTPTTTQCVGLFLQPLGGHGTITDLYDLYITTPAYGNGTITNHYAIYQTAATARNYFAGNVGIGRTAPASALDVNGAVTHALGSASAPTVTFTGDTNTGIYSPGADQVSIATGGVARFTVNASGRSLARANNERYAVGAAYSATSGFVYFGANNESATPDAVISGAGGGALMTLLNSGNVGIGTLTPGYKLDVVGSINVSSTLQLSGSTSGFVAFQSPAAPTSHTYTLPAVTGTAGQVLTTNGSSVLSWTTVSGGGSATTNASDLTSGTLNDARLSGNVVLTNDARLSDARTPTGAAGGDLTGTYPNPTIAVGAVVREDLSDLPRNVVNLYLWANFR